MDLPVQILPHGEGLDLPSYQSDHASGVDLRAAVDEAITVGPGERALIPTGLAIAVPVGFEAQIRPRSGLAFKHGITCLNTPGTIDADYRGEVKVILANLGGKPFVVERGNRIAQLVVTPVVRPRLVTLPTLPATDRGAGGFGHTGHR